MTRKDTILIAVVINAGLLAILFTTAVIYDTDKVNEQMEFTTPLVENKVPLVESSSNLIASASTGDEVDNVLKYYASPSHQSTLGQNQHEMYLSEPMNLQSMAADEEDSAEKEELPPTQNSFIEVTVKRGDVLEKIAKANKTTVSAIKKVNHLESERLSIGQVLKIPVKQTLPTRIGVPTQPESKVDIKKEEIKKDFKTNEPVYYVIKSGDNPWKIAKQFGVKYEEILRLNKLDEEKARNLKIGDRIRVK